MTRAATAAAVVLTLLAAGCALRRAPGPLVPVPARELPAFTDDLDPDSVARAVARTVPALERTGDAGRAAAARQLVAILRATPDPRARRSAIARAFRVVRVRDPLLLTAYYEPELDGRLERDASFRHPLYGRPPDLVDLDPQALDPSCSGCRRLTGRIENGRVHPYFSRAEIDAGALAGRELEVAWVDDPFSLFVLHVQGSGRLRLPGGRSVAVRYAGSNGRPYTSLGRTMVRRGLLPQNQASLWDIRRVLSGLSPDAQHELMATNERFTFFRLVEDDGEPVGSLGVPLTPGRSVATDPRLVPLGTVAYLTTPGVQRFVVSQDTGGAVVGAHADLFLGPGAEAEARAGRTRERGSLYLLLPR